MEGRVGYKSMFTAARSTSSKMRWDTVKHKWVLNECIFKWEVNDQCKRNILKFLVTKGLGLKQNKNVKEEWMDWDLQGWTWGNLKPRNFWLKTRQCMKWFMDVVKTRIVCKDRKGRKR